MEKIQSLVELATRLNEVTATSKYNAWEKADKKRIYIQGAGFNTKKMTTKVFIDLSGDRPFLNVYIDCPSQSLNWRKSQEEEICNEFASVIRYCRRFFSFKLSAQPVEVIMHNALLDAEEVTGYYTEWRQLKVAINGFGKLALRNRQFVIPLKTTKGQAPKTFVPCGPEGWAWLSRHGEFMLHPDEDLPDADERERLYVKYLKEEEERKKQLLVLSDQQSIALEKEKKERNDKRLQLIAEGATDVEAWKAVGCPHPAPSAIVELKKSSGLNWTEFMKTI